jgi:hypothetical protein
MGDIPKFTPKVEARMGYDRENVYVIFRVQDRYVKSVVQEYNGNVSGDSCVEFFFAPDPAKPLCYFNLEINAGGTPLIFYITKPMSGLTRLPPEEISRIEIAHSLPRVVDPEITDPVTWTIEARIPFSILEKYTPVARPAAGVQWKANFYKSELPHLVAGGIRTPELPPASIFRCHRFQITDTYRSTNNPKCLPT